MNMGYEEDELKPYQEAQTDLNDQKRIGKTGTVHFNHANIISWRSGELVSKFGCTFFTQNVRT